MSGAHPWILPATRGLKIRTVDCESGLKLPTNAFASHMTPLVLSSAMESMSMKMTETLIPELTESRMSAGQLPSLVCIFYLGKYFVIFGNRRLYAYRECAQRTRKEVWFQMIVHEFPACRYIKDRRLQKTFILKAIHAMDKQPGDKHRGEPIFM